MSDLHTKYRPQTFDDVIGQKPVVTAIKGIVEKKSSHAFLLTGPSGCGKTTIARIIANMLPKPEIIEIDAATHTGIDAWRDVTASLQYSPMNGGTKCVIVDEAHALSKAAWQSLLKDVEEPPKHVYWFFCTTESSKVPETIKTRCSCFELAPVKVDDLHDLIDSVCAAEKGGPSEEIRGLIARSSFGSPRRALTNLAACWAAKTTNEAAIILKAAEDQDDVIAIARGIVKGNLTWERAREIFTALAGQNPEGLRLTMQAYFSKVLLGCQTADKAARVLPMLDAFSRPYPAGATDIAPFVLDVCTFIFPSE